ncbi:heavy metal-binding protein HIP-like [Mytilus galloprovincialis]|uniref:heavy metal-binding protein HIP-like n=1 Tax=Mytilus galloprovincialis TaxID=29158 RepID=UPI003F7B8A8F
MFLGPCAGLLTLLNVVLTLQLDENSPCSGLGCRKTVSMPLLDQMKGNLKADFDVSEMNQLLKVYIDQEIRSGVEIGIKNSVDNMINSRMQQVQQEAASVIDKNMSRFLSDFESKMTKLKQDNEKELNEMKKVSKKYAFFATLSSSHDNLPANTVVMFDTVSLNEGDAYDGTTGEFTCPEDGLYHFSWTTVSNARKDFVSVLVANDRKIAENAVDSDSVSDGMTGTSNVIVRMRNGQKAWLAVSSSDGKQLRNSWNGSPCSMFSGFKL